jgi:exopolyphosphatase/guanosine-5'-triphosphate,3'-diphosphate pyrophosphatase
VRYACIDLGSNTTRLLVAEVREGRIHPLLEDRVFTRVGTCLVEDRRIPREKVAEAAAVVEDQWRQAQELRPRDVALLTTAVVRQAVNGHELVSAIADRTGLEARVLSAQEEASLAFAGATRTLTAAPEGRVAVVDVGGGSSEVAVGTVVGGVEWFASLPVGSGLLADTHLSSDPPAGEEIAAMRRDVASAIDGLEVPDAGSAVAVGGSASSLRRLVGDELCEDTLARALGLLTTHTRDELAEQFELDPERVRLLPAGVVVLDELRARVPAPLSAGRGGIREGAILDLALGRPVGPDAPAGPG